MLRFIILMFLPITVWANGADVLEHPVHKCRTELATKYCGHIKYEGDTPADKDKYWRENKKCEKENNKKQSKVCQEVYKAGIDCESSVKSKCGSDYKCTGKAMQTCFGKMMEKFKP